MERKKKTRKVKGSKKPGKDEIYKSLKNKISISREEFDQCHKGRVSLNLLRYLMDLSIKGSDGSFVPSVWTIQQKKRKLMDLSIY